MKPNPCIIESPLAGDFRRNLRYGRWCMRALLDVGYAPFASHLLYPQCYHDANPEERETGIAAGLALRDDLVVLGAPVFLCNDLGVSGGMKRSISTTGLSLIEFSLRECRPEYWRAFECDEDPGATPGAVANASRREGHRRVKQ